MSKVIIDESKIEEYKAEFSATHCVFLPGFIEKNTLKNCVTKLQQTEFLAKTEIDKETGEFGKVLYIPPASVMPFTLNFLMNDRLLFSQLQKITGCEKIGNFIGRIHRSEGGEQHKIEWHGDNTDNRLLAITINLGTERYTGAKFQIRKKNTDNILREFGQTEAGDAFIFRIHPEFEHRLSTVESGRRTVGVGWFRSQPDFETYAKEHFLRSVPAGLR